MERTLRTIEVTFEENQVVIYRRHRYKQAIGWCPQCERETNHADPAAAARIASITTRMIYQRIEAGTVHFIEPPDGDVLVCIDSLDEEPI